jgi:dipeptidyl aminopeptidase/acylaminoacyl peptidase
MRTPFPVKSRLVLIMTTLIALVLATAVLSGGAGLTADSAEAAVTALPQQPGQARQQPPMDPDRARRLFVSADPADHPAANYERDIQGKARTDSIFAAVTAGVVEYRKFSYRSRIGDLDIPVYLYAPLQKKGPRGHAAMVWVHGGVHGNWTENYWPFVKEAVERGYVIIVPEYRGSTGYGEGFHEEIDYGGYEVDDAVTAVDYLKTLPYVDPDRIGIMGWSHGGYITLLALARFPGTFQCGAAIVPVTNLIFRLSYKGPSYQRQFATQKRIRGLPFEQREIYVERSPYYQVDKIQDPVLVHIATNDADVNYVECEPLVFALRDLKPNLSETKIYVDPPGGHSFSRRVNRQTLERDDTPEQLDSWNRTWAFLEWNLRPYLGG